MLCKIGDMCPEGNRVCCEQCDKRKNCDAACYNCSEKCGLTTHEGAADEI